MSKLDLQKHQMDMHYKLCIYGIGIFVAFILALVGSQYAGEAFALVAGLLGGDTLSGKN